MVECSREALENERRGIGHGARIWFGAFARRVNAFVSSPIATALAFIIVIAWAASGPAFHFSDGWQLFINTGTTIVTFLMVFVLNNAQSRDTAAMNAKLDALICAMEAADNRMIGLELQTEVVAAEIREDVVSHAQQALEVTERGAA